MSKKATGIAAIITVIIVITIITTITTKAETRTFNFTTDTKTSLTSKTGGQTSWTPLTECASVFSTAGKKSTRCWTDGSQDSSESGSLHTVRGFGTFSGTTTWATRTEHNTFTHHYEWCGTPAWSTCRTQRH